MNIPDKLGRRVKGLSGTALVDMESWPTPDEGALGEAFQTQYLKRKMGVKMYLDGYAEKVIREHCGLGIGHIYRLITEKCLEIHPDGLIYGWRGLIPNFHVKQYARKKTVKIDSFGYGAVGAMKSVLDLHPELRQSFERRILNAPHLDKLGAVKRPRQAYWKWFLDELRKLGYEQRKEWPFNTQTNGYVAVCRYVNQVLDANPKQAVRVLGGIESAKKLISGDGVERPVERAFQRVEMDAHKIDGRFCVMVPNNVGGYMPKIIHRIWVIVIIDVFSRAVLGYYLSMGKEVSKDDVMRTIKHALTQWHRRCLSFKDEAYVDGAALPSGASEKYIGICWDETSVDGALAETGKHIESILMDIVGSKLITPRTGFSSRRSKDDRPFIESFFRTLGTRGFQRLSNTTGASPKDKFGSDPDKVAFTSQFQLEYAEELIDVLIANYNATPHSALGYRSPLDYLGFLCSKPSAALRYADSTSVQGILSYRKKCRVNGNLKEGKSPYVNFESARYTNETLRQRFDLIGKCIWVVNHLEDDARVAKASTIEGQELGVLRAASPWHRLPHSLKVRRAINSAARKRMFFISNNADAVEVFLAFCESQPGGKLPVHPAYLEVRRILAQQAGQNIGKTMLENALLQAAGEGGKASEPEQKPKMPNNTDDNKLPPRRMAVTE